MAATATRPSYDHLVKLLVIGDSGVGKSSIILRFAEDTYTPAFVTTVGIDFKVKTLNVDGVRIKCQIWDTAGQERFRTITTSYYRGAMGILLVYDVGDEMSYNNVRMWMNQVEKHAPRDLSLILVGNKCDQPDSERAVSSERGCTLAKEYGIRFMECSAKNGDGVTRLFEIIAKDIWKRHVDEAEKKSSESVVSGSTLVPKHNVILDGPIETKPQSGACGGRMCA